MLNMVVWVISYGNIWVIWSSMLLHTILWLAHSWPLISGAVPCLWHHELGQRDPGGRPRWISPENPGNLGCVKWDTIYIYIYRSHIYIYKSHICIYRYMHILIDMSIIWYYLLFRTYEYPKTWNFKGGCLRLRRTGRSSGQFRGPT